MLLHRRALSKFTRIPDSSAGSCHLLLLSLLALSPPAFGQDKISFSFHGIPKSLQGQLERNMPPVVYNGQVNRLQEMILSSNLRLRNALEAYGYYGAGWKTSTHPLQKGNVQVVYRIVPGKPVKIRKAEVRITGDIRRYPGILRAIRPFPLHPGEILDQVRYESWKGTSQAYLEARGFIRARYLRHEILIDRDRFWADIYLFLNSGPRYHVGRIAIKGAETYPRWFIERYLAVRTGQWYSPAALSLSLSNLHDADRFANIQVTGETAKASAGTVPILVHMDSLPAQHLKVGVGYSTDIGLNGILDYDNYNMFQRAQHLQIALQAAQNTRNLGAAYIWPVGSALGSEYIVNASYQTETYQVWTANNILAGAGRKWALANNARKNLNTYLQTMVNLEQSSYAVSGEAGHALYIYPSLNYTVENYRNILRPVSGYYVSATAEGAVRTLGSTSNFVRTTVRGGWDTVLDPHWGFGIRANMGALWLHGSIRNLPPNLRFFAGGQNSMPGYAYRSQGPADSNGVIGGRFLAIAGLHLERFIGKSWGIVAFYDAGNAFNRFRNFRALQDIGIGIRWYSPVGPIRLDLAHPLVSPQAPVIRLALSVGFTL